MSSLNKVLLIGRVGRDPEQKTWPSGDVHCDLSIATTETWKDKQSGEKKERTEWHRLTFNGRLAEVVCQYVKKGSLIYVEGSIKTRKYTDKDGAEKQAFEIACREMTMLGSKSDGDSSGRDSNTSSPSRAPAASRPAAGKPSFDDDGDVPF